ncbi:hypothetical protein RIF29_22957 [Crotalaria pallida]|uniref:Uncharacterized protein n=1 Tax=Crotalaria pallida TaxID=3830 RepID=A0AAN9I772_CROPI
MSSKWDNFVRTHHNNLKSLFQRNISNKNNRSSPYSSSPEDASPKPIPQLSPLANSVVSRCSKILGTTPQELQHDFDSELPLGVKELLTYARNLLELCSHKALRKFTSSSDYLNDKDFRRLTFDMMLAWEAPSVHSDQETPTTFSKDESGDEDEDEEGSLFYSTSTSMALQVDDNKTVGLEAFSRIAPVCVTIADIITVHNLFDALTASSAHRLHFLVYDKYLRYLDKVIKNSKNVLANSVANLQLAEDEIILDVDGTIPTLPVLQHIGISAWPGRLTLTNYALYFESLGVGVYEKAIRYDLGTDMKQVIKPDLTGPLGARLFDKAVMFKSTSVAEPVYFEFPEFKANMRRDYWLDISLEVLHVHKFIRKYHLKEAQKSEVLARAILGIFRYRAVREAFNFFSSHYKTLLTFNLAEALPRGDMILETLSNSLTNLGAVSGKRDIPGSVDTKRQVVVSPVSALALSCLGFKSNFFYEDTTVIGDIRVGEINPLEVAVKQSLLDTGKAQVAQASVDQVKVEGIDTNVAVMKELLFPVIESANRLQHLASWKDFYKSAAFLLLACYMIVRGWIHYFLPSIFVLIATVMLWRRHFKKGRSLEAFRVTPPPNRNAVEQLLTLQEAITQFESVVQAGNIALLKIRALLLAILPQATEKVALLLVFIAAVLAFVPPKYIFLAVFIECYTREMPYRKESSDRWIRRIREWWIRIPAAPVQLIKPDDCKKRK